LRRGLFLVSQAVDLGLPTVVALNMADEARRAGNAVSAEELSKALGGLPVVETVASKGLGKDALLDAAAKTAANPVFPAEDRLWRASSSLPSGDGSRWERLRAADPLCDRADEIKDRYAWAAALHRSLGLKTATPRKTSDALDRILLHPALGFALFLVSMGAIFQAVFSWATPGTELIEALVGAAQEAAAGALSEGVFRDLVVDGAIEGVGAVLVFLPQILILFLLLGILEDTGYMARAAFIVDLPLRAIGLSGRAFIPLLSSYACAVPGIIATRTIENRRERLLTILVAPLTTCSARLPVYTLLVGTFVSEGTIGFGVDRRAAAMTALYVGGAVAMSLAAFVLGRTLLRGGAEAPILELPPYRAPSPSAVFHRLRFRASAFVVRAGTLIFVASVALWAAAYFPRTESPPGTPPEVAAATQLRESYVGRLGRTIEPVIEPLGFDWKIGVGLAASIAAREVFVSTTSVVYAVGESDDAESPDLRAALRAAKRDGSEDPVYTPPVVAALLAFFVVAPQCVSTLAVIRRETGSRGWALFAFAYLMAFAYLVSFATFRIAGGVA
jgi:ferrous iron transport protein B